MGDGYYYRGLLFMKDVDKALPLHGGDIVTASERYGIEIDQWIDLSTGINPEPYPVNHIAENAFHCLPYLQPAFNRAVKQYYQNHPFIAVTGTQAAIQLLPRLLKHQSILIPKVGYSEHAKHWQKAGVSLQAYPSFSSDEMIESIEKSLVVNSAQHVLVINPNNPTSIFIENKKLIAWAERLGEGSYLIVDEAFMDMTPERSLLSEKSLPENIIVLRSFGKFFGLAGIRLGFVFTNQLLLKAVENELGLWQVNGPAQAIAIDALQNVDWQEKARGTIAQNMYCTQQLFEHLMETLKVQAYYHHPLFSSYLMKEKQALWVNEYFAQSGILTRVVVLENNKALLRIGLLSSTSKDKVKRVSNSVELCIEALNGQSRKLEGHL